MRGLKHEYKFQPNVRDLPFWNRGKQSTPDEFSDAQRKKRNKKRKQQRKSRKSNRRK